jgi:hypothetical protein
MLLSGKLSLTIWTHIIESQMGPNDKSESPLFRLALIRCLIVAGNSLTGMLVGTFAPEIFDVALQSTAEFIYYAFIIIGLVIGTALAFLYSQVKTILWIAVTQLLLAVLLGVVIFWGSLGEDPYDILASWFRYYALTSVALCFVALLVVGIHIGFTQLLRRKSVT